MFSNSLHVGRKALLSDLVRLLQHLVWCIAHTSVRRLVFLSETCRVSQAHDVLCTWQEEFGMVTVVKTCALDFLLVITCHAGVRGSSCFSHKPGWVSDREHHSLGAQCTD